MRKITLKEKKEALIQYLLMKVKAEDWHAVSDAANDLREVEIEIKYETEVH
jgi:hypothetical protein